MIFLFVGGINHGKSKKLSTNKKKYKVPFYNAITKGPDFEMYVKYKDKYLVLESLDDADRKIKIEEIERTLPFCTHCKRKIDGIDVKRSDFYKATYYVMMCHGKKQTITVTDEQVRRGEVPSFEFAF